MKLKAIIGCMLVAAMLLVPSPTLALSLGVSPTHVVLEVPGDGSTIANVKIHYFDGDVEISLIDIPLRIEPSTIHVEASDNPVPIELTIYGDNTLGSQTYDGYIRFIAVSGGAATGGVQVIAKVTNLVEGVMPTKVTVVEEPKLVTKEAPPVVPPPSIVTDLPVAVPPVDLPVPIPAPAPPAEPTKLLPPLPSTSPETQWPILPVAGIAAGAVVIMVLIFVFKRRLRH